MGSPIGLPKGRDVKNDLIVGLTTGLVQVPEAMATAILAAVKPVNGLNEGGSACALWPPDVQCRVSVNEEDGS